MRKATIKRFTAPDYSGTEAINTICTNLSFSGRNCKRIAFTSYMPGAGKTYISVNVLYNLAKRGKRVLLVDADLRRSNIVSRLRMETDGEMLGLAHYLAGHCNLDDCIYETNMYGAAPYLQSEFPELRGSQKKANAILIAWIKSFEMKEGGEPC